MHCCSRTSESYCREGIQDKTADITHLIIAHEVFCNPKVFKDLQTVFRRAPTQMPRGRIFTLECPWARWHIALPPGPLAQTAPDSLWPRLEPNKSVPGWKTLKVFSGREKTTVRFFCLLFVQSNLIWQRREPIRSRL